MAEGLDEPGRFDRDGVFRYSYGCSPAPGAVCPACGGTGRLQAPDSAAAAPAESGGIAFSYDAKGRLPRPAAETGLEAISEPVTPGPPGPDSDRPPGL